MSNFVNGGGQSTSLDTGLLYNPSPWQNLIIKRNDAGLKPVRSTGLSIVVPVYNECQNIRRLCAEIECAAELTKLDWEVIFVDDASEDDTIGVLSSLLSEHIRAIRLARNSGQSTALWVGMRVCRYSIVSTMDGDGQNNPKDLPALLDALSKYDMVCGIRVHRQDNLWRRMVSRAANRVRSKLTGDGVQDTGCSLKAMNYKVVEAMLFFRGAHRFMPALAQMVGFRVGEVPVSHRPRINGQTKYGNWIRLKATIPDLLGFIWLKSRYCRFEGREL